MFTRPSDHLVRVLPHLHSHRQEDVRPVRELPMRRVPLLGHGGYHSHYVIREPAGSDHRGRPHGSFLRPACNHTAASFEVDDAGDNPSCKNCRGHRTAWWSRLEKTDAA